MNARKFIVPALLSGTLLGGLSTGAQAELLEYTYTSPDGDAKTAAANAEFANPKGDMTFALSAGLDRKVRVTLLNADGSTFRGATSELLGANDRIEVNGSSYYGARLKLPAPRDGEYTIKAEILSSAGDPVQTDLHPVVFDTTPPTSDAPKAWSNRLLELLGRDAYVYVYNVIDDGVGVASGKWFTVDKSGVRREYHLSYSMSNKQVAAHGWGFKQTMPVERELYDVGIEIFDKAGNKLTHSWSAMYDGQVPELVTEIFDEPSQTWVPYVENMEVYKNPVKTRNKFRKVDHTKFNGTNFGWDSYYHSEDADNVYYDRTIQLPVPSNQGSYSFYTKAGSRAWFNPKDLKLTMAGEAAPAPVLKTAQFYDSETGEPVTTSRYTKPFTLNKVVVTVEPRPYKQTVWERGDSTTTCELAANETECVLPMAFSIDQSPKSGITYVYAKQTDGPMQAYHYNWWYLDSTAPIITKLSYDLAKRWIHLNYEDTDRQQNGQFGTWSRSVYAIRNGQRNTMTQRLYQEVSQGVWNTAYDAGRLPEGEYAIEAIVKDSHGNEAKETLPSIVVDKTSPTITITRPDRIQSLDDIKVTLTDTLDKEPKMLSMALSGGPAKDNVKLSWRVGEEGQYGLEYPIMFPSLKAGETYKLVVKAEDRQGNPAQEELTFEYQPRLVSLTNADDSGGVLIPAVPYEFVYADGGRVLESEPLTLADGAVLQGTYDVFATLRSDAEVALVVNGVRLEPGETASVMTQHDFGSSRGRLSIPLHPADPGVIGSSSLLVHTAAPNSPVMLVDVTTWLGHAKLSAEKWELRQMIDLAQIEVTPPADVPCRFSTNPSDSMNADPIRDPVCLIQWDLLPEGVTSATQDAEGNLTTKLAGRVGKLGEYPITYSMFMFTREGTKVRVGGGQSRELLTVIAADNSVGYQPDAQSQTINRVIDSLDLSLVQTHGPKCRLTTDRDAAAYETGKDAGGETPLFCYLNWTALPDGIYQDLAADAPRLRGVFAEKGSYGINWHITTFTRDGVEIPLATQSFDIEAVDPPAPTLSLASKHHLKDNLYVVPMVGDYLGDAMIQSEDADLDITIKREDEVIEQGTFWPAKGKLRRRVETDERPLWSQTRYSVDVGYNKIPDIKTTADYIAITSPRAAIKPLVDLEGQTALDTDGLPVKVRIRDQWRPDDGFDASIMGNWKVRLVRQLAYGKTEPLTDYQDATGGEAKFNVDLLSLNATSLRIIAEAVLQSPVAGYERTEQSSRPVFMTVLRGGKIGADVVARKLSGQAPFKAALKIGLHDRADYRATGDVVWETSTDGGQTWESYVPDERYKFQMVRVFELGEYLVRAKLINKYSGVETYTESVNVVAYNRPQIAIEGPRTLFVGATGNFNASLKLDGNEIPASDMVVEWSIDGGKNYDYRQASIALSRAEDSRIRLWARARSKTAPAEDTYAYHVAKKVVEFKPVRPPRSTLSGPRIIETGKTYTYKARIRFPYLGMEAPVHGYFTLPDGTRVNGTEATYTPTETDLMQSHVETTYTAWVEGYRDQGAESVSTMRSRVWQYVWPSWAIVSRQTANVAPASIVVRVRPIAFRGVLEEPTYDWVLPNGVVVEDDRQATVRTFAVAKPGDYKVSVTIRDARGHESVVEQTIPIGTPEPYKVEMRYSSSNREMREPVDLLIRPYISGGHPHDRITELHYSLNGEALPLAGSYGRATLMAGLHNLGLKVVSRMGHTADTAAAVQVVVNKPPTCAITTRETVSSRVFYAKCTDPDGRLRQYEWYINGDKISLTSDRITVNKAKPDVPPKVTLVGVDDSGGRSPVATTN